ncbi:MAG: DUF5666 domain-containing protein, partial [Candidatus Wolfebacteria bacterium]|nr:DUF5666 domain-containing protein [Candidatus Wolfebacteria bacterium]
LNVASWGGTWVVNAANAKLTRRFGGASNLSEFQNGDLLAISGTVAQSGWAVTAGTIKNNSIQTKNASFSGTISNFNASNQTFTLQTTSRGNVAISVNASTTILLRGKQVNFSDLASSTRATVSGIWDRNQSAFMASKIIGKITASDSNSTSTSH